MYGVSMALFPDYWILHVHSSHTLLFDNRYVMSSRKWPGSLPSISIFFFSRSLLLNTWRLDCSKLFSFRGPASVCLPGRTGRLLSQRGMLVTESTLCKMIHFTTMGKGQRQQEEGVANPLFSLLLSLQK